MSEIIKYRIGDTLHKFIVQGDTLIHCDTGQEVCPINKAEKHPCGCKLLTPRVATIAALNRLIDQHGVDEVNRRLEL